MINYSSRDRLRETIPVFGSVAQITALRCLAQIPLELTQGQFIDIRARMTATTNYTTKNVNFVRKIRIEPTPGENWGQNVDPIKGNDDYCVVGKIGFHFNGNITPDMHHYSTEISCTWEVTETGLWYIKLCSRAHSTGAVSSDALNIDLAGLEVAVY